MFNQTQNTFKIGGNTSSVSFNAPCTGIIQKSHPKSRFVKYHHSSPLAKCFFTVEPYIDVRDKNIEYREVYIKVPITILQLMAFGDGEFICEYVFNSDLIDTP